MKPPESLPEDQAAVEAKPRLPLRALARLLLLVGLVGTGFLLLRFSPLAGMMEEQALVVALERLRESWWAPAALIGSYVVLCPLGVPASPMMIAGGVVFGTALGGLYGWLGTFLAALVSYVMARTLARDFVLHLLGARLLRIERALARRGFWNLVRVRFLPLPFALVNYGAAIAGARPGPYALSTAMGLLPANFLFAYFAATLFRAAAGERSGLVLQLGLATALLLLLTFLPTFLNARKRRKRYRVVRTLRDQRRGKGD